MRESPIAAVADILFEAERDRAAVAPLTDLAPGDLSAAYAVQRHNAERAIAAGRHLVGRKIGLTSKAVQAQLGVDQPDFGTLFADMQIEGSVCAADTLIQPKIEAEVAFVLDRDIEDDLIEGPALMRAIGFALPALEIVDSRIESWKITIVDTIADNGSSARFVLGQDPRRLTDLSLGTAGMVMTRNGHDVSLGTGAACLGHPLNAALWLARTMAAHGAPLKAGDIILTGALGPMVPAARGERFEARIAGFEPVSVTFE